MENESLHEHDPNITFDKILNEARRKEPSKPGLKSDKELTGEYDSEKKKKRSRSISSILQSYERSYANKVEFQDKYRKKLFWGCAIAIGIFILAILRILDYTELNLEKIDLSGVAALITVILSLSVSVIKLINIITKYCFPKNDEKYIIKIVKSIQNHDLKRMQMHNEFMKLHNAEPHKNNSFTQNSKMNQAVKFVKLIFRRKKH